MKSMQHPPPGTLARAPATRRPALRHSLLTLAAVLLAGCLSSLDGGAPDGAAAGHDAPGDVPPSPSCLPGRSLPCTCPDGRAGARVCLASGHAYAPCTCESPAPPPAPCPLPPPADCSRAVGVCAGAVPRCDAELGWVCRPEPPVPFQPLGETLCDVLDNDCDG